MIRVHATCVCVSSVGVLLRGPSGAGKSDLALRLIDGGAKLVADDRVELADEGGRLVARAPAGISGLIEVRGVGILPVPVMETACVALVVDLVAPGDMDRLPAGETIRLAGIEAALVRLAPFEASAPAKVRLAAAVAAAGLPFVPSSIDMAR